MHWTERLPHTLERFSRIGVEVGDDDDTRLAKATLTLVTAMLGLLAIVWVVVYWVLGEWLAAAIPFGFQLVVVASLATFPLHKRLVVLRSLLLVLMLVLPFALQWSLGGFTRSSATAVWALATPALAFMLGARPWVWFGGFAVLSVLSGLIDSRLAANTGETLGAAITTTFFVLNMLCVAFSYFVALLYFSRQRSRIRQQLLVERQRSDTLLLNVLPAEIAGRLKSGESPIADAHDQVTILFADIVDFTAMSAHMTPAAVVSSLNDLFTAFDRLAAQFDVEKIKTIGDGYEVVAGAPRPNPDHVAVIADMAVAMMEVAGEARLGSESVRLRIGIDTGPAVAAVIGTTKFSYDLWGDAVNMASRMESHGVADRIQVTSAVRDELADSFAFEHRGEIDVKGRGPTETWFLLGRLLESD